MRRKRIFGAASAAGAVLCALNACGAHASAPAPVPATSDAGGAPFAAPIVPGAYQEIDVPVTMRDGTILRADVFLPSKNGQLPAGVTFPVLVDRTPYDKRWELKTYSTFRHAIERGYAVVVVDVRGRFASDGAFDPYRHEGLDGYDTIEWAAAQPWSNGKVGTWGLSYPGAVQWLAAVESPPHLLAMVPAMTFSTPRRFFYYGGAFDQTWLQWAYTDIAPNTRAKKGLPGLTSEDAALAEWNTNVDALLGKLPLTAVGDIAETAPFYNAWATHGPYDAYWDFADFTDKYDRVKAAVLHLSGWHDEAYGPLGALDNYVGLLRARASDVDKKTAVVIGPWRHSVQYISKSKIGDLEMGDQARVDYDVLVLDWMDRYVRGVASTPDVVGAESTPEEANARSLHAAIAAGHLVNTFVMGGANVWRHEDAWPPLAAAETLYLHGAPPGGTDRAGALGEAAPLEESAGTAYAADPKSRVHLADATKDPNYGAYDLRAIGERPDVLTFETPALDADTEVRGPIAAKIYLTVDTPDVDLAVKVVDVAPDGSAWSLLSPAAEMLRASYRDGGPAKKTIRPGEIVEMNMPNLVTGNRFAAGHKIRVFVSSSFYPAVSPNLQTGLNEAMESATRVAHVTVLHDRAHPSAIVLPVIPASASTRKFDGR
jgi:predicted acyl esterase